ncbi:hypothetical protein ACIBH1_40785 [Nonomuraea sp. NPDC050663]|uniref:hypothetical protein n=1 Tax=Nonomuraea sp. NPDC050663 TaxID=3364370 RepID=UPI0037A473B4
MSYNGGNVIVAFPLPGDRSVSTDPAFRKGYDPSLGGPTPNAYQRGCPYGSLTFWKCLYDQTSWGGRMVQYKDMGVQNLPTDFYNKAESAVNTGSPYFAIPHDMNIFMNTGGTGPVVAHVPEDGEISSFGTMNNKAKSIYVYHRY